LAQEINWAYGKVWGGDITGGFYRRMSWNINNFSLHAIKQENNP
jgi:hypothetical protein